MAVFLSMKRATKCSGLFLLSLAVSSMAMSQEESAPAANYIWSDKPAVVVRPDQSEAVGGFGKPGAAWERQGYPIGNGRIGAMVFSGDQRERFDLNEISLWSGGKNPGGGYGYGPDSGDDQFGSYQPFGGFVVDFGMQGEIKNFRRGLDLLQAETKTTYIQDGVTYTRRAFASAPAQAIVIQYTASKAKSFSATFSMDTQHGASITAKGNTLTLEGTLKNGLQYMGKAVILPTGGTATVSGNNIVVNKVDSCVVILAMDTNYVMNAKKNFRESDPISKMKAYLGKALKTPIAQLSQEHLAAHKNLFDRVKLNLGKSSSDKVALPTPERLNAYKTDKTDPQLEETLYQLGRYLMLSSSRSNTLPANLQGLWNCYVAAPWACDYHNNINFQMAYWGTETANLPECHTSMINFIEAMAPGCREVSQKHFKTQKGEPARGWTVRTSQNIFGGNGWEWNIPGSAWYALHMWEKYAFSLDKEYLKKQAYPMMKEICHFWEDHLKELGEGGKSFKSAGKELVDQPELKNIKAGTLVAPDGWSPEHGPREDGVMHDQQLIRELFVNTIRAANILGVDQAWAKSLADKLKKLAPNKIGKEGNLQEWMIDRIAKTEHRHTSHLFAVFPGNEISLLKTPELAEAARKSLEWRGTTGDSRRSWAWPWRTALWARFEDGEKAHDMVAGLLEYNTLPNMLTTHAPMQMDGNFGIVAGITEMLLQSHTGEIVLLPAPTKAWPDGAVKGLRARGNCIVDFTWKNGKVTNYSITSPNPRPVKIKVNGKSMLVTPKKA